MATTSNLISAGGVLRPQKLGKGAMEAFLAKSEADAAIETASTFCGSSVSDLSSSASVSMPIRSPSQNDAFDWMTDLAKAHSVASEKSPIEVVVEEPEGTEDSTTVDALTPDFSEADFRVLSTKKVSICQQLKEKGAAQPTLFVPSVKKKEKDCSEENHFGLCDHYQSLLERAVEYGFSTIKFIGGFTLHHLAAKRNNMEFLHYLLSQNVDSIHAIDEFGKKPVDYACPKKKDTVYYMLEKIIQHVSAPDTEEEKAYQEAKLGIVKEKKIKKSTGPGGNIAEDQDMSNVAEGVVALKRPEDLLTAYEAEKMVPPEYQKILKQLNSGGSYENVQWPKGTPLLHWAARAGKDDLCRFLVFEFRVDTRAEDLCGRSAIYHAKLKKHRKLAKKLISNFGFW